MTLDPAFDASKAVVVTAGGSLESFESFVCPSGDLPALAAFLSNRPGLRLAATGANMPFGIDDQQ